MEMKTKIFRKEINNFDIFPNRNILIFSENEIYILESFTYKPIFNYKNDKISKIIILSNDNILLYLENEIDHSLIILNITNPKKNQEKKFEIKFNYKIRDEYFEKDLVKLKNNRILFYYEYDYDIDYADTSFCFIFYKYNKKTSNIEFEYEKEAKFIDLGYFIPYKDINSFFIFGNCSYCYCSNPNPIDLHTIYLYINNNFVSILNSENVDMLDIWESNLNQYIYDCFILKKKYLIVVMASLINKYEIIENKCKLILQKDFNNNNYKDYLIKDESNFYLIYQKDETNNDDYIFIEFDEACNKIKEENKKLNNFIKILVNDKNIYLLSEDDVRILL